MTSKLAAALVAIFVATAASPAFAQVDGKDCLDIRDHVNAAEDNYTIEPKPGVVFDVYCKDMATNPKSYLALPAGAGENFSCITSFDADYHEDGTTACTSFTKVRIDPSTLLVDIGDLTFAELSGTPVGGVAALPYGVAMACINHHNGNASIDIEGTPFKVSSSFYNAGDVNYFFSEGYIFSYVPEPREILGEWEPGFWAAVYLRGAPKASASVTVTGQHIHLNGGGSCGGTGPVGFNANVSTWRNPSLAMPALQLQYVGL